MTSPAQSTNIGWLYIRDFIVTENPSDELDEFFMGVCKLIADLSGADSNSEYPLKPLNRMCGGSRQKAFDLVTGRIDPAYVWRHRDAFNRAFDSVLAAANGGTEMEWEHE